MNKYSEKTHADLLAHQAKLETEFKTVSDKLNDRYNSDEAFDDAAHAEYARHQARHGQLTREIGVVSDKASAMANLEPAKVKEAMDNPLSRYLRKGVDGLATDERQEYLGEVMDSSIPGGGGETFSIKAATRSDDATGQELKQETISPNIVDRLKFYGGVATFANQITTANGNELRIPQHDQASTEGELLAAQNTAVSATDLANIGQITLNGHTMSSKPIRITNEMVADSSINIGGYAEDQALRRLGRGWNRYFSKGTGTNQPQGVEGIATAGVTAAAVNAITLTETVNLAYSIDRAYRMRSEGGEFGLMQTPGVGMVGYMISDDCEKILATLIDSDMRPLWRPSATAGLPNTLNGYPYVVNGHMDSVATGKIPMLFGDFSLYTIRTVGQIDMYRFFDSRTAQTNSMEILAFSRRDGRCNGALVAGDCEGIAKLTMA